MPDLAGAGPVASYGAGPSGVLGGGGGGGGVGRDVAIERGRYDSAGPSAPFATWSGTGWYRYAICGGSLNLCVKKNCQSARP